MMSEFKREPRYAVFKLSDVKKYLRSAGREMLMRLGDEIALHRMCDGRPPLNAVVVEQDWPEFEMVWASIEERTAREKNNGTT